MKTEKENDNLKRDKLFLAIFLAIFIGIPSGIIITQWIKELLVLIYFRQEFITKGFLLQQLNNFYVLTVGFVIIGLGLLIMLQLSKQYELLNRNKK